MSVCRSDVIGSLLSPEHLKEAHKKYTSGKLTHAGFRKIKNRSMNETIGIQLKAGAALIRAAMLELAGSPNAFTVGCLTSPLWRHVGVLMKVRQ